MVRFLARRAVSLAFVLFSLTFLTFMIGHLAPGDPILVLMGQSRDPDTYARLQHLYGLDRPLLEQYGIYVLGLLHGDFGLSFQYTGRPVREIIGQGVKISIEVGGLALLLSLWCQHSPHFQYAWDLMRAMLFGPFQIFFVCSGVVMALFAIPYANETQREA